MGSCFASCIIILGMVGVNIINIEYEFNNNHLFIEIVREFSTSAEFEKENTV
jgi:hypothetical protein